MTDGRRPLGTANHTMHKDGNSGDIGLLDRRKPGSAGEESSEEKVRPGV